MTKVSIFTTLITMYYGKLVMLQHLMILSLKFH